MLPKRRERHKDVWALIVQLSFHFISNAYSKSLLFLGFGLVIHSMARMSNALALGPLIPIREYPTV